MLTTTRTYATTPVAALDVWTGLITAFLVLHEAEHVLEIRYRDGAGVPKNTEQFTETEAAFLLDYMAEESDVDARFRRCYL